MPDAATARRIEFRGAGSSNAIDGPVPLFSCSACWAVVRGDDTEAHRKWHSKPSASVTVTRRVAEVLLDHLQVTQEQVPGAVVANPCLCGWGELGQAHVNHVAEMLRRAGLLIPEETR